MSIYALLHSRPNGPQPEMSPQQALRNSVAHIMTPERMEKFQKCGKTGAKLFGITLMAGLLSAYAPDSAAQTPHVPANPALVFVQTMEYAQHHIPQGVQFATDAAAGAIKMAGAVAYNINETVIAPSMGAVRAHGNDISLWIASQRDALVELGTQFGAGVKEVADHLIPKNKGEMIERAILIVAALKSFAEGVSVAVSNMRRFGRWITGRKEETPAAEPVAQRVEIHHHHYYGGTAPTPPVDPARAPEAPEVSDTMGSPDQDAANDNDYGSPQA